MKMMSARASSASNKSIRPRYVDSQNEVSSVRPRRSNKTIPASSVAEKENPSLVGQGRKEDFNGSPALTVRKNGIAMIVRLVLM